MSEKTCYAYVIGIEGQDISKIGISENPRTRLKQLSTGSPFKMSLFHVFALPNKKIAEFIEQAFHHIQRAKRKNGEWFDLHPDKAVFIMSVNIITAMHVKLLPSMDDDQFRMCAQMVGFPDGFLGEEYSLDQDPA